METDTERHFSSQNTRDQEFVRNMQIEAKLLLLSVPLSFSVVLNCSSCTSSPHPPNPLICQQSAHFPSYKFSAHSANMLGTLCTLITALTCKEADWLQLWPHVGFISLCVSLDSMSSCCFQVWVVLPWWHRSLLSRWGKERQPPWTVTWGLLLTVLLAGINRFQEEFLSMCWGFITATALYIMALVFPLQSSLLLISQQQIIVWSSTMWRRETQQSITVTHGITLSMNTYHSDLHCDKNLLSSTSAFWVTDTSVTRVIKQHYKKELCTLLKKIRH